MSNARTIEWASVAEWVAENEQQIRDVMKFEGLKGAMVEVLRLAPEQSELAALREELAAAKHDIASFLETMAKVCDLLGINTEDAKHAEGNPSDVFFSHATAMQQRLTAAEQRNAELTKAIADAEYRADQGKVWNGMGWTYTGLHSHGQQKVLDILRAALKRTESGASE